jgi:hypothetical protein
MRESLLPSVFLDLKPTVLSGYEMQLATSITPMPYSEKPWPVGTTSSIVRRAIADRTASM